MCSFQCAKDSNGNSARKGQTTISNVVTGLTSGHQPTSVNSEMIGKEGSSCKRSITPYQSTNLSLTFHLLKQLPEVSLGIIPFLLQSQPLPVKILSVFVHILSFLAASSMLSPAQHNVVIDVQTQNNSKKVQLLERGSLNLTDSKNDKWHRS